MWERDKKLEIGDLVYHILYGKSWLGVVVDVAAPETGLANGRSAALVHMVPGSEYCTHFEKAFSKPVGPRQGWITTNWLIKFEPNLENK